MKMRAEPNFLTIRPADGNETTGAYIQAIENRNRPSCLVLSRQAIPNLKGSSAEKVAKGAYVLQENFEGQPANGVRVFVHSFCSQFLFTVFVHSFC